MYFHLLIRSILTKIDRILSLCVARLRSTPVNADFVHLSGIHLPFDKPISHFFFAFFCRSLSAMISSSVICLGLSVSYPPSGCFYFYSLATNINIYVSYISHNLLPFQPLAFYVFVFHRFISKSLALRLFFIYFILFGCLQQIMHRSSIFVWILLFFSWGDT